jgi:CRP-like cAMP-binding protein
MKDVLALCDAFPERHVAKGELLIRKGEHADRIYVLKRGAFEVVRDGVNVIEVSEPGSFLGEMAAVLEQPAASDVVANRASVVHVIEDASATIHHSPALIWAIAQLLARRLNGVTAYLVDLRHQYADTDTHLGLMDRVLTHLVQIHPPKQRLGSERGDVPDY